MSYKIVKQSFENRLKRQGILNINSSELERQEQIIFRFYNVPFWRWDLSVDKHYRLYKAEECNCFNCQIRWARKNNFEYPLFDYQKRYLDTLERHRLVACIKARASGISEVTLRYMEYLALRNKRLAGTQMIIAASAAEEQTLSFMRRIRAHLEPIFGNFETREKTLLLNGVRIQTVPSHNLLQLRGITNVSVLVLEESSFWREAEEREILPIILPLRQKNPNIIISLISTPGRIGSLMHQIHMSTPDKTPFKKVYIPCTDVVGKLFTQEEIDEAKRTNIAFEREYNLAFGFGIEGNLFNPVWIQQAIDLAKGYAAKDPRYPSVIYREYNKGVMIGVDFGAGASDFSISCCQLYDRKLHVAVSENHNRPDEDAMIKRTLELRKIAGGNCRVYVDGSAISFIKRLKSKIPGEQVDYEQQLSYLRATTKGTDWLGDHEQKLYNFMQVIPVNFNRNADRLLQLLYVYLQKNFIAIDSRFTNLINDLQEAHVKTNVNSDWSLEKKGDNHALDSLRCCLFPLDITHREQKHNS